MKISIVTPVYNCEKYIRETIESIKNQSYQNFEHIIIDGKSTDNTLSIIKEYNYLSLISEKDQGQTDAINKGFRLTNGDILAWQNADDTYEPETFKKVVDFFKNNKDVDVLYGSYKVIDSKSTWVCDVYNKKWNKFLFSHGRFVPLQPTVFWRRSVYEQIGELDIALHFCMDVDFFARASQKFKFASTKEFLGSFRIHNESKTHNPINKLDVLKEMHVVLAKNFKYNFIDSSIFWLFMLRANIAEFIKTKWLKRF